MGLPAVPTLWEPIATIPKLDFKVVNLPDELIFTAQCASKFINSVDVDIKFNNLFY